MACLYNPKTFGKTMAQSIKNERKKWSKFHEKKLMGQREVSYSVPATIWWKFRENGARGSVKTKSPPFTMTNWVKEASHFEQIGTKVSAMTANCEFCLREGSHYQIGWIFWKTPNGLWPPPHFWKFLLQIFIKDIVSFMQGGIGQIVPVNFS